MNDSEAWSQWGVFQRRTQHSRPERPPDPKLSFCNLPFIRNSLGLASSSIKHLLNWVSWSDLIARSPFKTKEQRYLKKTHSSTHKGQFPPGLPPSSPSLGSHSVSLLRSLCLPPGKGQDTEHERTLFSLSKPLPHVSPACSYSSVFHMLPLYWLCSLGS